MIRKRNIVHVLLDDFGYVEAIKGNCHQKSCIRIDLCHMERRRAVGMLRQRVYERAGGLIGDRLVDGELIDIRPGRCACGCGATASWYSGEMDERVPRGKGGLMSFDNSQWLTRACHRKKHSGRAPQLEWV